MAVSNHKFRDPKAAFAEAEKRMRKALKTSATSLDLSGLGLTEVPESVVQLKQLRVLHLYLNELTTLPNSVGRLKRLESLRLDDNQFSMLPSCVAELTLLQALYVDGNNLTVLPEWIGELENLETLSLSENRIRVLPDSFRKLRRLQRFSLSINELTELPEWIGELVELRDFYPYSNRIQRLPTSLERLSGQLGHLFLHGNPGLNLPPEVLGPNYDEVTKQGKPAASPADILDYYFRANKRPLNEAKLILLGRGEVGKTCLVNRLVHDKFERTSLTHGIEITQWPVTTDNNTVRMHVWDFGGQEIQHATHQFFLTERSLYLVVLDGRAGADDEDAEYWLKFVRTFGTSAPIDDKTEAVTSPTIVVLNKFKMQPFRVNRRALEEKYSFIKGFVETDCEPDIDNGIPQLRDEIESALGKMTHVREGFPAEWFNIKDRLAEMPKRGEQYISFAEYRKICADLGENDPQAQERLAGFMNALGIALNFRDDSRLRDETVLNPHWITDGVYKIITNSMLAERQGELRLDDLTNILPKETYPSRMHGFLIELMRKFELCFPYHEDPTKHRYLVPELLGVEEPALLNDLFPTKDCLSFRYKYKLMPEGLLPRLITRTHTMSELAERWRTGVVLRWEGCRALIKADKQERLVFVRVFGDPKKQRRLLSVIRENFDEIHSEMKEFKPSEELALEVERDEDPLRWISYAKLETFERNHEQEFKEDQGDRIVTVRVRQMLERTDVRGSWMRGESRTADDRPLKLFVSYAHQDEKWRAVLAHNLNILKRAGLVEIWCDLELKPGDMWSDKIQRKLEEADLYLFLMSSFLLDSDFVQDIELPIARRRHEANKARLIPVVVRACGWERFVGDIQVLPKDGRPLKNWTDRDKACLNVEEGLEKVIVEVRKMLGRT